MRTFGFIIVGVGILLAYLGYQGKAGRALTALWTGVDPGNGMGNDAPATGGIFNPSGDTPAQKKIIESHPVMDNHGKPFNGGAIGSKVGWGG